MLVDTELQPPLSYQSHYFWWGVALAAFIACAYIAIFVVTRRRKQRTLATLRPKKYTPPDVTAIKQKYLSLIEQVEMQCKNKTISSRVAHQSLSKLVRLFIYEVNGNRVDTFTLDQLRRSRYPEVTKAVEAYYPPSFQRVTHDADAAAFQLAREVVTSWN